MVEISKFIKPGVGLLILLGVAGFFIYKNPKLASAPAVDTSTRYVLAVPFTAQAPNGNWDRNEDCEEASITMANAFLTDNTRDKLPPEASQEAINTLKRWEEANLGYNADTGVDATTRMAEGAFGLKVKQIKDYTAEDLKKELLDGHPILLPINAKHIGNPLYQNSGPLYHMIVVRGFDGDNFIVNDPGTDGGDGSTYSFAVLKSASADWDNRTKAMDGTRKIALVLSK